MGESGREWERERGSEGKGGTYFAPEYSYVQSVSHDTGCTDSAVPHFKLRAFHQLFILIGAVSTDDGDTAGSEINTRPDWFPPMR